MGATRQESSGRWGERELYDRLISAALVSLYDDRVLEGMLRTGQGKSAVIKGRDPLDEMEF